MMRNTAQQQVSSDEDDLNGYISAGMDGELDDHALNRILQACKQDAHCQSQWETYHMIGDILRQTPLTSGNLAAKVSRHLADEPTVLAPRRQRNVGKYAMPMAASIAAVMLVTWSALNLPGPSAHAPAPSLATAQLQQDKFNQVQLADFIAAHRDYSPGATSPFVNAAYEVSTERSR